MLYIHVFCLCGEIEISLTHFSVFGVYITLQSVEYKWSSVLKKVQPMGYSQWASSLPSICLLLYIREGCLKEINNEKTIEHLFETTFAHDVTIHDWVIPVKATPSYYNVSPWSYFPPEKLIPWLNHSRLSKIHWIARYYMKLLRHAVTLITSLTHSLSR